MSALVTMLGWPRKPRRTISLRSTPWSGGKAQRLDITQLSSGSVYSWPSISVAAMYHTAIACIASLPGHVLSSGSAPGVSDGFKKFLSFDLRATTRRARSSVRSSSPWKSSSAQSIASSSARKDSARASGHRRRSGTLAEAKVRTSILSPV